MPDPTGFLRYARSEAPKRPVSERIADWKEFALPAGEPLLREQAARCMDCGVPFCQSQNGCPVDNLIPEWNDLVRQGRWQEALVRLHATNNFPEFTGKLCPAPCESACVLGHPAVGNDAVTIRSIESAIVERGWQEGWIRPLPSLRKTGRSVAVVGSGPAGLAAAQQLARGGHDVTVFERASRPGGLLRYGIPDFKLEKRFIDRRLAQLEAEGVTFRTGVEIGRDLTLEQLRHSFDAVCLTIGAEKPRDLGVHGRELEGVHFAMDYLTQQNLLNDGAETPEARIHAQGRHVIIIGGGDTGSDCLGTALRQGAASVRQFEILPEPPAARHESTPWPFWPMKLRTSHAHEEGGVRHWSVATTGLIGSGGRVVALKGVRVAMSGSRFEPVPGTDFTLPADLVILAMGFTGPRPLESLGGPSLRTDPRGNIAADDSGTTSIPGIFAAGDARRGASLIVWAIAEGRRMADAVDHYLTRPARS